MASVKKAHQCSSVPEPKYKIKYSYQIGLQTNNAILGFLKPGTFAAMLFSKLQTTTFPLPSKSASKSSLYFIDGNFKFCLTLTPISFFF